MPKRSSGYPDRLLICGGIEVPSMGYFSMVYPLLIVYMYINHPIFTEYHQNKSVNLFIHKVHLLVPRSHDF